MKEMAQSDNSLTAASGNSEMAARLDAMYEVVTKGTGMR